MISGYLLTTGGSLARTRVRPGGEVREYRGWEIIAGVREGGGTSSQRVRWVKGDSGLTKIAEPRIKSDNIGFTM